MARGARTARKAVPAADAPSADSSDNEDDPSDDDAEEAEETLEEANDPDPAQVYGTRHGPESESVTPYTLKRESTCAYYETVIGLDRTASYALFVEQGLEDAKHFLRVKPDMIEKICIAIVKKHKTTTISVRAIENLTLLAYYVKHQVRTSRDDKKLTDITSDDLDGLIHHMEVELNWDKRNKTPEPTNVTLDESSAHKAFSNMKLLLSNMRGHNDVPLAYVIRPRLLPPDWGSYDPKYQPRFGEVGSPYTSIDDS
jgi:hypothetical protein